MDENFTQTFSLEELNTTVDFENQTSGWAYEMTKEADISDGILQIPDVGCMSQIAVRCVQKHSLHNKIQQAASSGVVSFTYSSE